MQFFIIHHCVLIFIITFIFTTDPASADVCTVWGKLHQSVILPCKHQCSKLAKWTEVNTRFSFAQCDQTSCRSLQGYEMSHDQYKNGDLSLTITSADYNKRNTYACECGATDFSTQTLKISTVFSIVQKIPAEDLLLDLSVPEPVQVFYRSSDTDKEKLICSVNQSSVQCEDKYTSRTSLHQLQLTLRRLGYSDSGTYTIRNTDYNEDIHVYSVSVTGLSKAVTIVIVVVLVVVLLGIVVVLMYLYIKLKKSKNPVEEDIKKIVSVKKDTVEEREELKKMIMRTEEKINKMEEDYSKHWILTGHVTLYCITKRLELEMYYNKYTIDIPNQERDIKQVLMQVERVGRICRALRYDKNLKPLEQKIQYDLGKSDLEMIKAWYNEQRKDLNPNQQDDKAKVILKMFEDWCNKKTKELDNLKPEEEKKRFYELDNLKPEEGD